MKVFSAICVQRHEIVAEVSGEPGVLDKLVLERGKEYTVSAPHDDGTRTVFTRYWFRAPVDVFAGVEPR